MKRLEDKIPELQAKLRSGMKQAPARAGSSSADGLTRRVEVLEEAVDTLLDAQVCLRALHCTRLVAHSTGSLLYFHTPCSCRSAECMRPCP